MKVIDMLDRIAKGEEVKFKIIETDEVLNLTKDMHLFSITYNEPIEWFIDEEWLNYEVKVIEEDKIIVEDKEGNKKEYFIKLNGGLKEGEKIFKQDNEWYVQKLVSPESEFYKWIEQFKPEIYYTLEDKTIEEDKKIEEIDMFDYFTGYDYGRTNKKLLTDLEYNFVKLNSKINEIIDYINKEVK